ncbi:MAG: ABC transporter ATP-binding protein [Planctomycetota bacterium]|nr:MAG: ABC transporter ATP-binding protein [Planctomycetota bacterium]
MHAAISIQGVTHRYGARVAVNDLSLEVAAGEVFAFLGPNGSGKTTLFRLLSTLIPLQRGAAAVLGCDLSRNVAAARRAMGVVFQSPSVDKKLTVAENLQYHGRLYGLAAAELASRRDELLAAVGLADRAGDRVETLSGGMRRRVELAKCMLHRPRLLLLDEPSTGLDPGARSDLWHYLSRLRQQDGTTIVLTTHLLDEADRADRIAIMHRGALAALGAPDELRREVGGDAITIETDRPGELATAISDRFGVQPAVVDGAVRLEQPEGHQWIPRLVEAFPADVRTITLGKPTLEDVFIARTGHRFFGGPNDSRENAQESQEE